MQEHRKWASATSKVVLHVLGEVWRQRFFLPNTFMLMILHSIAVLSIETLHGETRNIVLVQGEKERMIWSAFCFAPSLKAVKIQRMFSSVAGSTPKYRICSCKAHGSQFSTFSVLAAAAVLQVWLYAICAVQYTSRSGELWRLPRRKPRPCLTAHLCLQSSLGPTIHDGLLVCSLLQSHLDLAGTFVFTMNWARCSTTN